MDKKLNRTRLEEAMHQLGLSQTAVADELKVTRASVSKWVMGKSFPRPPELLKLGKLLRLGHRDLVTLTPLRAEPIIAFRKRASTKTTDAHIALAKEMGRLLEPVGKHLPFDAFVGPGRLKNPSLDYRYIQGLVAELRRELKLDPTGPVKFEDLISKFNELHAVIIPVMWGQKTRHENALHVYLPEAKTTWIYVNLDSHLHDFKFWMAHELGHVLSVNLLEEGKTEMAEDFADAFAGALLFPESAAGTYHARYQAEATMPARLRIVIEAAELYTISPFSIYKEIEHYAKTHGAAFTPLPAGRLHASIAQFNKKYLSVSESLFDAKTPSADRYIRIGEEAFRTPFFTALGGYLKESPQSDALISRLLDVPMVDAKELHAALV